MNSLAALRRLATPLALTLGLAAAAFLAAGAGAEPLAPVNRTDSGSLALKGHDPVAYFDEGRPVAGSAEHTLEWGGAVWRFASAERRDRFAAAPERYAPQYGGYCAWAVAHGYTADADPAAWAIVDGKLYVNYDLGVKAKWDQARARLIEQGDANWPRLLAGDGD